MKSLSRRDFLKSSLATAGLTLAVSIGPFGYRIVNASQGGGGSAGPAPHLKPNVWFEIAPDGTVTISIPSSEMGQGVRTSLAMIVADELEADWQSVRAVQSPAADPFKSPLLGAQVTVASASVRGFYAPLRKAGATGRAMMLAAAAQTWDVPEEECEALNGAVKHGKSGRTLAYGALAGKAAELPVPPEPPLKKESEFRYIGKSMPRVDIPEKVSGEGVFGLDVDLPGMLYAALARPPAYGAKPSSFDQAAAEATPGVRKVVQTPNGIAVCAETLAAAWKGREALKAQWSPGSHPEMNNASIEKQFLEDLEKAGAVAANVGDAAQAVAGAPKKVEATYFVPFVAHATMEPMNATAHVQADRCDLWVPTQGQTLAQNVAAKLAELPPANVHVHTTLLGCGLGRRSRPDFVMDAVVASKATGKPVKVVWTREEDIRYDYFRAATAQRIRAGVDEEARLTGWSHKVACSSILRFANPAAIKNGVDLYSLWGIVDAPNAPTHGNTAYGFPNFHVEQVLSDLPVPVCPWRSVQNAPNAFVVECFLDELAHAAGKDPVEFRLPLLANNMRARRVLQAAAEKAGWGKAAAKGKGRGIAQHACFGSYVAQVADIAVDEKTGRIRVERVVAAVDCGPVVNPDPLIAQIEGSIILALSTTLKEHIRFESGGVKSANFDDYPILTMSETPEIEVHIVKSTEAIGGIGEVGVPPTAPAVANAFFNATGARVRRLPLNPSTVLEALKTRKS
jgi:isoquinoline 1-oxidoreductase subunit beta